MFVNFEVIKLVCSSKRECVVRCANKIKKFSSESWKFYTWFYAISRQCKFLKKDFLQQDIYVFVE